MPTSDHNLNRTELIDAALAMLGVDSPSSDERAKAVKKLNTIVKRIDVEGRWIWGISNTESTLTLVAAQQAYITGVGASHISANILDLEWVAILQSSTHRIPLEIISKEQSIRSVLKDDTGQPVAVHLEKAPLRSNQRALFYPTPNAADTVVYAFRRPLYDFDLATDNPDFPSAWQECLEYQLAYALSHEYGIPLNERILLKGEAKESLKLMLADNQPNHTIQRMRIEEF